MIKSRWCSRLPNQLAKPTPFRFAQMTSHFISSARKFRVGIMHRNRKHIPIWQHCLQSHSSAIPCLFCTWRSSSRYDPVPFRLPITRHGGLCQSIVQFGRRQLPYMSFRRISPCLCGFLQCSLVQSGSQNFVRTLLVSGVDLFATNRSIFWNTKYKFTFQSVEELFDWADFSLCKEVSFDHHIS